jgi:hypothetical protein
MSEQAERSERQRTAAKGRLSEQALPLPAPAPFGSWAERRIGRAKINTTGDSRLDEEIREALVQVAAEADRLWDGIARRSKGPADDPDLRAEIVAMLRSLEGVWARERHEAVDYTWARRAAARAAAWGAAASALEQLDPLLIDRAPEEITVEPIRTLAAAPVNGVTHPSTRGVASATERARAERERVRAEEKAARERARAEAKAAREKARAEAKAAREKEAAKAKAAREKAAAKAKAERERKAKVERDRKAKAERERKAKVGVKRPEAAKSRRESAERRRPFAVRSTGRRATKRERDLVQRTARGKKSDSGKKKSTPKAKSLTPARRAAKRRVSAKRRPAGR